MKRGCAAFLITFFICFFMFVGQLLADVVLKVVVVNPSETLERVVPIRKTLPLGINKDDIVDSAGLKVDYDVKDGLYYVYGDVSLGPKESKTFKIMIKDVWTIPDDEINGLYDMLDTKIEAIQDPEEQQAAELVGASLRERLDALTKEQTELAGDVDKRIQYFSAMQQKLKAIKDEILSLEDVVKYAGDEAENNEVLTLVVEAKNVLDKTLEVPLKYYLPSEIIPDYIVSKGDFELKYDYDRAQFYLAKTETFGPQEVKRFSIEIRNVWRIPEKLVEEYVHQSGELSAKLENTGYGDIASVLSQEIERIAGEILASQRAAEGVKEHIATYRENQKKLDVIKDNLEKMRRLLANLQEEQVVSTTKEVRNVLRDIEVLSGMKKVSDAVFKRIQKVATWKIIMTVVGFVIVLTVFFNITWFINLKKEENRKLQKIGKQE